MAKKMGRCPNNVSRSVIVFGLLLRIRGMSKFDELTAGSREFAL